MKNIYFILLCVAGVYISSCKSGEADKAQEAVKSYLKANLKHSESYESGAFSSIDSVKQSDTLFNKSTYSIKHTYSAMNASNEKTNMSVIFYLDKDFKVTQMNDSNINGNHGSFEGDIIWEYNNAGGKKPDEGSDISLYSLSNVSNTPSHHVQVDKDGNFNIKKILSGKYYVIVRSGNKIECPELFLKKISINDKYIKQIFGFDIHQYDEQLNKIYKMYDEYNTVVFENDFDKYGGIYAMVDKMTAMQKELRKEAVALIESFPEKFKKEIKLNGGYSNAYDFSFVKN